MIGPRRVRADVEAAHSPNARARRRAVERGGDDRERAGHEQRAGGALEEARDDQELERRREPAQDRDRRRTRSAR